LGTRRWRGKLDIPKSRTNVDSSSSSSSSTTTTNFASFSSVSASASYVTVELSSCKGKFGRGSMLTTKLILTATRVTS